MVCTWILIMKAWQKFLLRVTTIWQSSMQKQAAYVYMVFKEYHHMELCKDFFFQYLDLHVSIFFFSIAYASLLLFFNKNWRERPIHIVEHLFCGMSGWYNANFSKKHSKGYMVCTWILIMKAWQKFLSRVTTIWQISMQDKQHMCIRFSS